MLHDPQYREKHAQNLKREFPCIPFYKDFWQWEAWGEALMDLHISHEAVAPFPLTRTGVPDATVRAAGLQPEALLPSDVAAGSITLDTETTLRGIPPEAWAYELGNRCVYRLGDGPVQIEKAQRPHHPREVRHLPFCRLQRQGD